MTHVNRIREYLEAAEAAQGATPDARVPVLVVDLAEIAREFEAADALEVRLRAEARFWRLVVAWLLPALAVAVGLLLVELGR